MSSCLMWCVCACVCVWVCQRVLVCMLERAPACEWYVRIVCVHGCTHLYDMYVRVNVRVWGYASFCVRERACVRTCGKERVSMRLRWVLSCETVRNYWRHTHTRIANNHTHTYTHTITRKHTHTSMFLYTSPAFMCVFASNARAGWNVNSTEYSLCVGSLSVCVCAHTTRSCATTLASTSSSFARTSRSLTYCASAGTHTHMHTHTHTHTNSNTRRTHTSALLVIKIHESTYTHMGFIGLGPRTHTHTHTHIHTRTHTHSTVAMILFYTGVCGNGKRQIVAFYFCFSQWLVFRLQKT